MRRTNPSPNPGGTPGSPDETRRARLRSTDSVRDRVLSRMIRSADSGFGPGVFLLDYLSRRGPVTVRRSLSTQVIRYGLQKMQDHLDRVRVAADPEAWNSFSERMIEPLLRLALAGEGLEVLVYGDRVFQVARDFPGFVEILKVPLRWHDAIANSAGLRGEGGLPEVTHDAPSNFSVEEPITAVQAVSRNLVDELAAGFEEGFSREYSSKYESMLQQVIEERSFAGGEMLLEALEEEVSPAGETGAFEVSPELASASPSEGAPAAPAAEATGERNVLHEPAPASPSVGAAAAPAAAPMEETRFTDVTIYKGHLYASEDVHGASRLPEERPLVIGRAYTLEVAIRRVRTGIGTSVVAPHGVYNPRRDQEDLTIYVLARPEGSEIEINEAFAKIEWPYNADSESALFRLDVKTVPAGKRPESSIEVRVFDGSLDLLDTVRVVVSVVAEESDQPAAVVLTQRMVWPDNNARIPLVDPKNPLRSLSIDVSFDTESQSYRFLFKFLRDAGEGVEQGSDRRERNLVEIPGSSTVTDEDLKDLLVKVRNFWTGLAITNYASELTVSAPTFDRYLNALRDLGTQAWSLLFGDRYAAQAGASETIGNLLTALEPKEGTLIQIVHGRLKDFVFPWSILYPPNPDQRPVDPLRFWGARYQIEQVRDGPERDVLGDLPIGVMFALDPSFGNADAQKQLLQDYQSAAGGRLVVTHPISDQTTFFEQLARNPSAHLLYFYCHGYAPTGPGILHRDGVQQLKKTIEELPEDSKERKALETLLALTAKMNDEAWIYIGGAQITESKLKFQKFFEKRRPIVFLNMCQSADLLPSMSSGLIRLFLDHNASAVIGTESPMTAVFANAFSQVVFDSLFSGDDVGRALWNARRHFLTDAIRNPLGLAYTLYGRAVARLGTGPIVDSAPPSSTVDPTVTNN